MRRRRLEQETKEESLPYTTIILLVLRYPFLTWNFLKGCKLGDLIDCFRLFIYILENYCIVYLVLIVLSVTVIFHIVLLYYLTNLTSLMTYGCYRFGWCCYPVLSQEIGAEKLHTTKGSTIRATLQVPVVENERRAEDVTP